MIPDPSTSRRNVNSTSKSETVAVRLPHNVLQDIAECAARRGITRAAVMKERLSQPSSKDQISAEPAGRSRRSEAGRVEPSAAVAGKPPAGS